MLVMFVLPHYMIALSPWSTPFKLLNLAVAHHYDTRAGIVLTDLLLSLIVFRH